MDEKWAFLALKAEPMKFAYRSLVTGVIMFRMGQQGVDWDTNF